MAIKRKDFQKLSSTVQEFLLKLPDEEASARLRDNLLHALHFLQLYYRILQNRDKDTDPLQWNIDHSLSPLTPFREAPDKFEWEWINVDSSKVRQSLPRGTAESFKTLPPIIVAIKEGDASLVKHIIKEDPDAIYQCDLFSRDCLTYAVEFDRPEILQMLLKHNAKVNSQANDGSTCLHRAVYKGDATMVKLLLQYDAYVNAQDSYNRSPLHWSVIHEDASCLKALIENDANVHIKDRDGMSPTMWACHLDRIQHFQLLSREDNDVNDVDNDGRTWAHWCVRKQPPLECLHTLLTAESAYYRDKEGKTCLHVAAEQGAIDACKIIIEIAGRDIIHMKDNKKQTPLHLATLNGHARAIKLLIENGADTYQKDAAGASPIDYVTKRNLLFCNSIIEICLNKEKRSRQATELSMGGASSVNGELTPAPPTTPKSSFNRNFQANHSPINTPTQSNTVPTFKESHNRPPRPHVRTQRNQHSYTEGMPPQESMEAHESEMYGHPSHAHSENFLQPTPPSMNHKGRPNGPFNHRGGWTKTPERGINVPSVSSDRVPSASIKLSRASSRTSFISEDLERYMNNGSQPINQNKVPPQPIPRVTPSNRQNSASNRILSARSQETAQLLYDSTPPPVKPRKAPSIRSNSYNNINSDPDEENHNRNVHQNNVNTSNTRVEDLSDEEYHSITSTKGEGCASDFSDSELRREVGHKKKHKNSLSNQDYTKRPSTPMDIRPDQQPQQPQQQVAIRTRLNEGSASMNPNRSLKYQQIGEQQVSYRFNEWDPFKNSEIKQQQVQQANERQKSPLKSKLHSDSSPRQTSGRGSLSSANQQSFQDRIQNDSNLDLMVSGQKLSRKETSPTNTPREVAPLRPPTRRLQPIDRNSDSSLIQSENELQARITSPKTIKQQQQQQQQQERKKSSAKTNTLDRKKLEPIRTTNQNGNYDSGGHDGRSAPNQYVDDDQSVSENTVSSDKQQSRKTKTSAHQRSSYTANKRRYVENVMTSND